MANLRSWKNKLKKALLEYNEDNIDTDHPSCPRCESTMNFYGHNDIGDFPIGKGYWECPNCGFKITEDQIYK